MVASESASVLREMLKGERRTHRPPAATGPDFVTRGLHESSITPRSPPALHVTRTLIEPGARSTGRMRSPNSARLLSSIIAMMSPGRAAVSSQSVAAKRGVLPGRSNLRAKFAHPRKSAR